MSTPVHHVHMSTPALEISSSVPFFQRRQWHPTPVLLPGKSNGRRSLVGCSPWGREESDTTERLHFSLSTFMHWRRKWQPTPVFLPGESLGWRSLVGCSPWGHTESDTTEATRRSNQSILKEISPGISLEGMMLKLKLQRSEEHTSELQSR